MQVRFHNITEASKNRLMQVAVKWQAFFNVKMPGKELEEHFKANNSFYIRLIK
jgi:hypothetical protein